MVFFIESYSYEIFVASRAAPKKGSFNKEMPYLFNQIIVKKFIKEQQYNYSIQGLI